MQQQLLDTLGAPGGRGHGLQSEHFVNGAPRRLINSGHHVFDIEDVARHARHHDIGAVRRGDRRQPMRGFDARSLEGAVVQRVTQDGTAAEVWTQSVEGLGVGVHDRNGVPLAINGQRQLDANSAAADDDNVFAPRMCHDASLRQPNLAADGDTTCSHAWRQALLRHVKAEGMPAFFAPLRVQCPHSRLG